MKKLTKKHCRELSNSIPNEELLKIILRAMNEVTDWTKPSRANIGMSRGANWNFFCKDFDVTEKYSPIRKYRILEEFSEFISDSYKPLKVVKPKPNVTHFDPDFTKFIIE